MIKTRASILSALTFLAVLLSSFAASAQDKITTLGQISAVYQAQGDMMTLNSSAFPLRIPIGSTGQVLSVSGGIPVWSSTGIFTTLESATSLILKVRSDPQRLFTFDGSSDTALTLKFGDGGTTAVQQMLIAASTADADDDSSLILAGGGASGGTRGGTITLAGEEVSSGGDITLDAGAGDFTSIGTNGTPTVLIGTGFGVAFQQSGTTIEIQEATAGSACSGTLTANGATPVVTSTTCAATGSRIFTQRTSAETGVVNAWISAISNGVSFSITGEAGDTGTYNWFIIHEAA